MEYLARYLAQQCINAGIISSTSLEWCVYSILKRLTTLLTCGFLVLFGTIYFGFNETVVFSSCFLFLRKRTNGYHAPTYFSCLIMSLLLEFVCLWGAKKSSFYISFLFLLLSDLFIWFFSPSNNVKIHLVIDEIQALQKHARARLAILNFLCLICFLRFSNISSCIIAALVADAILLVIAHFNIKYFSQAGG